MASDSKGSQASETPMESGTYEIIRNRLLSHGKELRSRLEQLNQARKDIFGAIDPTLLATERLTTKNNCIPRDMVPIGQNRFIFGFNVQLGLKSEMNLSDVFAVYEYRDRMFHEMPLDVLQSGKFEEDFKNLYRYYKDTVFAKFSIIGPHLFMVFRTGKSPRDFKTFKWAMDETSITYMDNRSDHEFKYPAQHDFSWIRAQRDMFRYGTHPHVSIEDRVFVEAVGGDITFKVEDNTETGQGIYAEPVDNPDQTLDDADIRYAILGHIILVRIRPYQEEHTRYFIFNEKTETVHRVDEIAQACIRLPDDQGLIFPNGYYLQSGELKTFGNAASEMVFESRRDAANGEDYLYVFYQPVSGDYLMLPYNVIAQKVDTPMPCSGFSCFDNGEMLILKSDQNPTKHHVVQIWQTPYVSSDFAITEKTDSFLYKVGNPAIVRCMAECGELLRLIDREEVYAALYHDLMRKAGDIADAYFWLDKTEAFHLKEVILEIKTAASAAIDEFEKVIRVKTHTAAETQRVKADTTQALRHIATQSMDQIDQYVSGLSQLRNLRGQIISLKELRYVDLPEVEALESQVVEATDALSNGCVAFLLKPEALQPYIRRIEQIQASIASISKVKEANALAEEADAAGGELEMLIDIVSNLKIEDATQTTQIIDTISDIYSQLNQVRSAIRNQKKSLQTTEGIAQFNAEMRLLNQSVINFLDIADTPDKCDELLTKLMIQIEELESRFIDFEDFIDQLSEKRDDIYHAFESKKLNLVEARNRRADALMRAAERILKGIQNRVSSMDDINAINGYFAGDLMIEKLRDIVGQLVDLDDTVKADDIQGRLKSLQEDTVRQFKDRKELFVGGANVIQFGRHQFSVNVQPLDLTVVRRDADQWFHLTGTSFFEKIDDPRFNATRPVWDMDVVSENHRVYRGEYLAFQMLQALKSDHPDLNELRDLTHDQWVQRVREFMGPRYGEGYSKGIHDEDGAKILQILLEMESTIGLLRFPPQVRALARLFWRLFPEDDEKSILASKIHSFGLAHNLFGTGADQIDYIQELGEKIAQFVDHTGMFGKVDPLTAGRYLFFQLMEKNPTDGDRFVISKEAWQLKTRFEKQLAAKQFTNRFQESRNQVRQSPTAEFQLITDWVSGFAASLNESEYLPYVDEASVLIFGPANPNLLFQQIDVLDVDMSRDLEGLKGDHPLIVNGRYRFAYLSFVERMQHHVKETVPLFQQYQQLKKELTDHMRETMRLDEFRPRVLTSFVRNRLINQVYLPLIGDNLAKQIGVVGESKRTDLMGLLLLISPPGYGKTTLMEYIANRLGIIFMKINGPAIGNRVMSLDPAEAPNASAREEIEKLNLCLEMGDNVMLYLDDIQHCHPELLQKFISLCDAQRKIEGVYKGKSRTYDLRGKKVVVVMAGNPYTESGEKFKVPDMLTNRADTYNLGDIIGDSEDMFKMSYLENCLTSNAVLNKLATRSQKDVYTIIRIAETGDQEGVEFEGNYSADEIAEMVSVMKKLITVREIILKVNLQYIQSAGQADEYRTEPPFLLQGSYRNMNRIAEKVVPMMNDQELQTLILSHYENEAQTLTTGTEANLLKFKELTGWMTEQEAARWQEIKRTFVKNKLFHGTDGSDPINRVVAQLSGFHDGLESIRDVLASGMAQINGRSQPPPPELKMPSPLAISLDSTTLDTLKNLLEQIRPAEIRIPHISMAPAQTSAQSVTLDSFHGIPGQVTDGESDTDPKPPLDTIQHPPDLKELSREVTKMRPDVRIKEIPKHEFLPKLYSMIEQGNLNEVKKQLEQGTDPNAVNSQGKTPLMAAAFHGHPEIVRLFIEKGADVNAKDENGYTALMAAAYKGQVDVARILLQHYADPTPRDKEGLTALDWAVKKGHRKLANLLRGYHVT